VHAPGGHSFRIANKIGSAMGLQRKVEIESRACSASLRRELASSQADIVSSSIVGAAGAVKWHVFLVQFASPQAQRQALPVDCFLIRFATV
jgi:hypothetical protein